MTSPIPQMLSQVGTHLRGVGAEVASKLGKTLAPTAPSLKRRSSTLKRAAALQMELESMAEHLKARNVDVDTEWVMTFISKHQWYVETCSRDESAGDPSATQDLFMYVMMHPVVDSVLQSSAVEKAPATQTQMTVMRRLSIAKVEGGSLTEAVSQMRSELLFGDTCDGAGQDANSASDEAEGSCDAEDADDDADCVDSVSVADVPADGSAESCILKRRNDEALDRLSDGSAQADVLEIKQDAVGLATDDPCTVVPASDNTVVLDVSEASQPSKGVLPEQRQRIEADVQNRRSSLNQKLEDQRERIESGYAPSLAHLEADGRGRVTSAGRRTSLDEKLEARRERMAAGYAPAVPERPRIETRERTTTLDSKLAAQRARIDEDESS